MFAIKRNQVMVTALLAMVAVAGYLNFAHVYFLLWNTLREFYLWFTARKG